VRFLAMEHLEGRTLDQLVREGPLPVAELLRIAIPIAEALEAAHARGVLHRDLKPSNVMVCADGRVKVLDFGLAKLLEDPAKPFDGKNETTLTREGQVVGTLHYSSPEQLQQKPVDARTDIYSFGAVLYEMATGQVPFQGDSAAELVTAVLCDVPRRIDEISGRFPRNLAELVDLSLEKLPNRRPRTAEEALRKLEEVRWSFKPSETRLEVSLRMRVRWRQWWARLPIQYSAAMLLLLLSGGVASKFQRETTSSGVEHVQLDSSSATMPECPSVAVLPFRSTVEEATYFLDGFTDGVIGSLGRLRSIRVISRQSVSRYRNHRPSFDQVARELGVECLVLGSASRVEGSIEASISIVGGSPKIERWNKRLRRSESEVLTLQRELARWIANRAAPSADSQAESSRGTRAIPPKAYEAYLKGLMNVDRMLPETLDASIDFFREALSIDPEFSLAHLGLANAVGLKAYLFSDDLTLFNQMEVAARRAIELDPESGHAHAILGEVFRNRWWNWSVAEAHFLEAIRLEPHNSRARRSYWALLASLGRFEEARVQLAVARRLDPLSAAISYSASSQAIIEGDDETALHEARAALALDPDFVYPHIVFWNLEHRGVETERGRDASLARFVAALGYSEIAEEFLRSADAKSYQVRLLSMARALEDRSQTERVMVGLGAMLFALGGDLESAEKWVVRAYAKHDPELVWLGQDATFRELRKRPAVERILREMGLPAPSAAPGAWFDYRK